MTRLSSSYGEEIRAEIIIIKATRMCSRPWPRSVFIFFRYFLIRGLLLLLILVLVALSTPKRTPTVCQVQCMSSGLLSSLVSVCGFRSRKANIYRVATPWFGTFICFDDPIYRDWPLLFPLIIDMRFTILFFCSQSSTRAKEDVVLGRILATINSRRFSSSWFSL